MSEDALSDVIRVLKVGDAHYGQLDTDEPWAVEVQARQVLRVYAVLEGECVLETPASAPLRLASGDVAALLAPTAHTLKSPHGTRRVYPEAVLDATLSPLPPDPARDVEPRPGVRLVSGRIDCEEDSYWWKLFPPVLTMRGQTHALPWLEATLQFIAQEVHASRLGSQTLARRLTELLFVQLLSKELETANPMAPGWLSALGDPKIGRALSLLHSHPERPWTVGRLAAQLGMSRSAFANHFNRLVGDSPMHYLARLRMEKAAALLREGWAATGEIAGQVGYLSDASFCKAFKRTFGRAPGAYRQAFRAAPRGEQSVLEGQAA